MKTDRCAGSPREGERATVGKHDPLRDRLRDAPDVVELVFEDIADLVGGLPPSAFKYWAWWGTRRMVAMFRLVSSWARESVLSESIYWPIASGSSRTRSALPRELVRHVD
jgi:hypothetical protein